MFELAKKDAFAMPLRLVFWGTVLVLVDIPLPLWHWWPVPVAFDLLPDIVGAPMIVLGTWQLARLEADDGYRGLLEAANVLAFLGVAGATAELFWPLLHVRLRRLVSGYDIVQLVVLLLTALAVRRWCLCAGHRDPARRWRTSAILLATNVFMPLLVIATVHAGRAPEIVERNHWGRLLPLTVILFPLIVVGLGHVYGSIVAIDRPDDDQQRHAGFVWKGALGVYVSALLLGGALTGAYFLWPNEKSLFERLMEQQQQQQPGAPAPPFWKRWFQTDRAIPRPARRQREQRVTGRQAAAAGSAGPPGHALGPEELALRELAEAQNLLTMHPDNTERTAWDTVRHAPLNGPFRDFEEKRFLSRMLLHDFVDQPHDPEVLQRWATAAKAPLDDPRAAFEERFYGGVAYLMTGAPGKALPILEQALAEWPAPGSGYGNCYFFVMVCHAVLGHTDQVFDMLDDFQDVHPDWLYPENYLPDLIDVRRANPTAPLLDVLEGRLQYFVNDYAKAEQLWDRALRQPGLSGGAAARTRLWLLAARKERDG